jgi:hypothetical protein
LAKGARTITATLPKSQEPVWPCDLLTGTLTKFDLGQLPVISDPQQTLDSWNFLGEMYTLPEMQAKTFGTVCVRA